MSLKKILSFSIFIFLMGQIFAQTEKVELTGTIQCVGSGEKLPFVLINLKELNRWTTSDVNGKFSFKNITKGEYTITASCLGYKDYEMKINLNKNITNYLLKMEIYSLALKEVTVTATSRNKLNSASTIERAAIEHVQASNIAEVMQLLPGTLTTNPNLNTITKLTIRDITGKDATNSFGTAIIVDEARISNDANMQTTSTAISSQKISTSAGTGIDARQIAVDNIESIEVIRGIASAEYGDLNSGAVIVKTKAGKSPLEIRFKANPKIKQFYAGKGIPLRGNKEFLNIDADYVHSQNDIRSPAKSYNRLTTQLGYSNVFDINGMPLRFNAKLKALATLDKHKSDPDKASEEKTKAKEQEISLNIYGRWMINKPWLTGLKYTLAGSIGKQYNSDYEEHTTVGAVNTNAMESGEHIAGFLPYQYYSNLEIEGKPVYAQAKITANTSGKYGNVYNNFMLGGEWNTKGNEGKGRQFDSNYPPIQNIRQRSFKDIPYINEYSGFIEDKVKIDIGKKALEIASGSRFTKIKAKDTDFDIVIDPRFNMRLTLIENRRNKKGWENLSLRAGWGIQHKMPTLIHLFPDPAYIDKSSFSFKDDVNNYKLGIITTNVFETRNDELKIPKSNNLEIGIDFKVFNINGGLTYFKEKLTDGYTFSGYALPYNYREYNYNPGLTRPEYINGEVVENGIPVGYRTLNTFGVFMRPDNGLTTDKWGIEYSFNFGKIDILKTSILADGAYFNTKTLNNSLYMSHETIYINNEPFPYAGLYAGSTNLGNGKAYQRLNTNIRLVTHIPQLRLIFSLTTQCVWIDKQKNLSEYKGRRIAYMKDNTGNIVEGDISKDITFNKYINPVAYMDRQGQIFPFTKTEAEDPVFRHMIKSGRATYFTEDSLDPYFMLNLRMTKEIGKYATLSFYANNFTDAKPWRFYKSSGADFRVNSDLSFGAEISLKF